MILNCELIIGNKQQRARSAADSKILSIATDRYRVVLYSPEITVYTDITQEAKQSWPRLLNIKIIYGGDSRNDNVKRFLNTLDEIAGHRGSLATLELRACWANFIENHL